MPLADFAALLSLEVRAGSSGISTGYRSSPSWVLPSPRFSPLAAMWRLITVTPPIRFGLHPLCPVSQTVQTPAAPRSITRRRQWRCLSRGCRPLLRFLAAEFSLI